MKKKPTHIKDELKEQSPFLDAFMKERQGGFQLPDNYFEQLTGKIEERIQGEGTNDSATVVSIQKKTNVTRSRQPRLRIAAIAASVLLLVGTFWFLRPSTAVEDSGLANLSSEEVLEYLDQNMDDFQFEDLADAGIISSEELNYNSASDITEDEQDIFLDAALQDISGYN